MSMGLEPGGGSAMSSTLAGQISPRSGTRTGRVPVPARAGGPLAPDPRSRPRAAGPRRRSRGGRCSRMRSSTRWDTLQPDRERPLPSRGSSCASSDWSSRPDHSCRSARIARLARSIRSPSNSPGPSLPPRAPRGRGGAGSSGASGSGSLDPLMLREAREALMEKPTRYLGTSGASASEREPEARVGVGPAHPARTGRRKWLLQ